MSDNEKKLREALDKLLNFERLGLHGYLDASEHARQVLAETAPEPPKHPAEAGWEKHYQSGVYRFIGPRGDYMQGFKDALLFGSELSNGELSGHRDFRELLKETARTVPL